MTINNYFKVFLPQNLDIQKEMQKFQNDNLMTKELQSLMCPQTDISGAVVTYSVHRLR